MADETPPPQERDPNPSGPIAPSHDLTEDHVEVDDALDDNDSAFNESAASSHFTSLKSSLLNYKYENGRRYHAYKEGSYPVPNDEQEQDRMDMVHHIYSLLLRGRLFLAAVGDNVQRVLDLSIGTGIWAIDFADEHPAAEVIGIDLGPIQPAWYEDPSLECLLVTIISRTPPNCVFEVDDFESDWLYRHPFDFIHDRELVGCIANEEQLFQQAFRHMSPGGYIELQSVCAQFLSDDGTAQIATYAQSWINNMIDGAKRFGKPLDNPPQWKETLKNAGFVDVQQEIYKFPIRPWPKDPKMKEFGAWQYWQELQVVESYTHGIYSRVLGWTETEIEVFKAKVKNDFKNPSIHIYLPVYIVWGRKP